MKRKIKNNIPYQFKNEVTENEHVLVISGAIGESNWFYDATSSNDVRNALANVKADDTVRIKINSGGGDAMQGVEIYNYLKDLDAHVVVEITALAGSAASIIAMGGDEIVMRTGATMMIHEASTMAYGTKADIQKTMNALETVDEAIADIYVQKTGLPVEEIRNMMVAETWLTGEDALAKGFVTSVEAEKVEEVENKKAQNFVIDESVVNTLVERITAEISNKKLNEKPTLEEPVKVTNKRKGFLF